MMNETGPTGTPEISRHLPKVLRFLSRHYFRTKVVVEDPQLASGAAAEPVLFAGNHSGMCFNWDAHILRTILNDRGLPYRLLSAPSFYREALMQQFGVENFVALMHATEAGFGALDGIVAAGNVILFPEGIAGISKGYHRRYQLQSFSTSLVRVTLKHRRDIIPTYFINAEDLNPYTFRVAWLDRLMSHLGLPYFPLGPSTLLVILFPALFYAAMPAQVTVVLGKRIRPEELSADPVEKLDETEIRAITARLQQRMQSELNGHRQHFGKNPMDCPGLFRSFLRLGPRSIFLIPLFWPWMFHWARFRDEPRASRLIHGILASTLQVLPVVGWPLFILMRLVQGNLRSSGRV